MCVHAVGVIYCLFVLVATLLVTISERIIIRWPAWGREYSPLVESLLWIHDAEAQSSVLKYKRGKGDGQYLTHCPLG